MSENEAGTPQRVDLRKYPNRRYYDAARSQHVTLEEIHTLVRAGSDVHVTDSKTGEDLTAKVLAQIILEHDSPKLGIFPVELLHQMIRANEPLMRDFVEKYFRQAFSLFTQSQRQFEGYLRQAFGLRTSLPTGQDWTRMMMGPLAQMFFAPPGAAAPASPTPEPAVVADAAAEAAAVNAPPPEEPAAEDLSATVADLRRQIAALERELRRAKKHGRSRGRLSQDCKPAAARDPASL